MVHAVNALMLVSYRSLKPSRLLKSKAITGPRPTGALRRMVAASGMDMDDDAFPSGFLASVSSTNSLRPSSPVHAVEERDPRSARRLANNSNTNRLRCSSFNMCGSNALAVDAKSTWRSLRNHRSPSRKVWLGRGCWRLRSSASTPIICHSTGWKKSCRDTG